MDRLVERRAIANAGHGRREIAEAIARQAEAPLLRHFSFANSRGRCWWRGWPELLPEPLKKILLFTTGSEAIECAIKISRTYGVRSGGRAKHVVVSYDKAFHGRTLGAQQAGGIPELKEWIVNPDPGFVQVPFPDGYRTPDTSFEFFERSLRERRIEPQNVAAVIMETYQGGSAAFAPASYMKSLRQWCTGHKALLVLDEIQAGVRPHREAVGLRTFRNRPGRGGLRKGYFRFAPPGGRGRASRRAGSPPAAAA